MNQVLIYTKREEFRSYLDSECLNIRECFPVFYDNMGDLETILELFPKVDVLIADASQGPEEFEQLYHFVKDRKDKITHILLVSDKESDAYTRVFNSTDWSSLLQHLKVILGENETPKEGFVGIPLDCLIHFKVMPFALFLNVSPGKFIKRIPAFEPIDVDVIESYRERGVNEFFFERHYGKDFTMMLMTNMINRVELEYSSEAEKEHAVSEVFGTVRDIIASIGLKPRVIELCNTLMAQVIDDVDKGKGVQALSYLEKLRSRPELDFNYRMIQLTSFIATQILEGRSRAHKNDEIKAVIFSAFFCDMGLKNPEYVHHRNSQDVARLPEEDREEINWHANHSASMVELSKIGSPEAVTIIRQHHGDLYGTDIPSDVHPEVLDLSKCLMASQELAYALLTHAEDNLWKVYKEVLRQHKGAPLEEYLTVYEGSFLNYVKEAA
jgi:hypothetical protein